MRIAFYSPIAEPSAAKPSGISRVGALIVRALEVAKHTVDIPPLPRSFEGKGDAARQKQIFSECENAATNYLEAVAMGTAPRPDLWFSYHVYYKSPDWIGPRVARALKIPYIVAEGSHAPKRANGPWALGHDGATKALKAADRLLAMTRFDRVCLEAIAKARVRDLKPFIDTAPFATVARANRGNAPTLLAVAMMRNDRKLASFRLLGKALAKIPTLTTLVIAGDGDHRREVERSFAQTPRHHVKILGAIAHEQLPALMAQSDVLAWPGIGEAYGLVYLEAQAAGLPVVACDDRGVPDVVRADESALLSAANDPDGYAKNLTALLQDETKRRAMGAAARRFVTKERDLATAAATLRTIIAELKPA